VAVSFLHDQAVIARAILVETGGVEIAVLAGVGAGRGQAFDQREDLQARAQCLLLVRIGRGEADRYLASGHGGGGEAGDADDGGCESGNEGLGELGGHGVSP
jgi:hypothetical protein